MTTPALSDSISFISFIASMMQSVSPTCTRVADLDERLRAGRRRAVERADHRALDQVALGLRGRQSPGAARGGAAAAAAAAPAWRQSGLRHRRLRRTATARVMRTRSSPSWISSSAMPEVSTSSISVFSLRRSIGHLRAREYGAATCVRARQGCARGPSGDAGRSSAGAIAPRPLTSCGIAAGSLPQLRPLSSDIVELAAHAGTVAPATGSVTEPARGRASSRVRDRIWRRRPAPIALGTRDGLRCYQMHLAASIRAIADR